MAAQAHDGRKAALEHAREIQRQKLIRQADPTGELATADPGELERRLAELRRVKYTEMARKSHAARRSARAKQEALDAATIAAEAVLRAYARVGAA